ncbi:MAG: hypothetical protein KKD64_03735 [Alphaproteobacteria bacterium]|jgi:hypothetical protein|uniref:hypothetical protein n=1 Tax=Sphingomonas sp. KC8 TaxID=1030157 RepID=UPI000495474D|nr:hypothetical protein [Sphingomonas sp. KC8]ARS28383.1 hypothetical protein KC8_13950 [Sphingomonas sp. KC8]MBU0555958.1 hypothetical protein [Alphaproteobacteria bacterium]MBU0831006.1 hypothetical protein [Alphaproteobacteria bacterium]MBU1768745.1 hypothetical protein [Alphaproteobacteria bacterium]|tara:strand:- start:11987 stop:12259 length:273 start_codon:yes stop_codon:yes gene_type:complete
MSDIDTMLARLRDAPVPARLAAIDIAIMEDLARLQSAPRLSGTVFGMAAAVALVIGIATSAVSLNPRETDPVSPFDARLALAPSTLLDVR